MHWYYANGQPCYELPNASKPGVMRQTNLGDAKKLGLFPGVTEIQKAAAKNDLENYKLSNVVLTTIANPKNETENVDAYVKRIVMESKEKSKPARDIGDGVHDYIERVLSGKEIKEDFSKYAQPAIDWFRKEMTGKTFSFERYIVPTFYAGRVDACFDMDAIVIDWKTQGTKEGKFKYYPEMPEQLSAYAKALGYQKPRLISAMISTTEMGLFEAHEWGDQFPYWYASFEAVYKVWSVRNNYGLYKLN